MSKETKVKEQEVEEIADAKAGAVVKAETGAVSTQVNVRGASIRFATMSPFYAVSSAPQECAQECREGDFYVKTGKTTAWRFSGSGKKNAVRAFVVDGKLGILEGFKGAANGTIPRSWAVGRPWQDKDGNTVVLGTIQKCVEAAQQETGGTVPLYRFEDYSKATNPIPDHYLSRCLYLELLAQVPDGFAGDVPLVKVGAGLYTPVRVLFKKFDPIKVEQFFRNIQVREEVRHRGEEGWKWSPYGQCVSVSSVGVPITRPNGAQGYLWTPTVEAALDESGKLYVPDEEEIDDLAQFHASLADSTADIGEVDAGEFEG